MLSSIGKDGADQQPSALTMASPRESSSMWEWKFLLAVLSILALFYFEFRLQTLSSSLPCAAPVEVIRGGALSTAAAEEASRESSHALHRDVDVRRVAVCFYGLTRSLNFTIDSIEANLTGPISQQGYEVDVFVHTYDDIAHLTNPRTGEDSDLDVDQWHLLQPYQVSLTSQTSFLESEEKQIQKCLEKGTGWPGDPWETQVSSVHNLIAALNSLFEVGKLWERSHSERNYSAVVYARPDVRFSCPLPAQLLDILEAGTVYVPDFAQWGGINDRFALLKPEDASVWKRRVFFNIRECLRKPIHAEIFARDFTVAAGLSASEFERFGFVRIRSNGQASELDAEYSEMCAVKPLNHT